MKDEKFLELKDILKAQKSVDIESLKDLIKNKNQKDLLIICGSLYAIGDISGKINLCNF